MNHSNIAVNATVFGQMRRTGGSSIQAPAHGADLLDSWV